MSPLHDLKDMKMRLVLFLALLPGFALSQSTNASLNEDYYHWIDRYEVKAGRVVPEIFTSVKPYKRKAIVAFMDSLHTRDGVFTSRSDQFNYEYMRNDSWEWSGAETNSSKKPLLKKLYKKKSDFANVDIPDFDLHVNPVFYFGTGKDSRLSESLFTNTRGVEIRGMIDRKIGFYTYLSDNQAILPSYVHDQMLLNPVLPHETFWKTFKAHGVDYFQARGYIDFNISKHIYMQFGNDRTFIGNGYRSLIFSDYSPPNLFLRTNVKVWKINYLFQLNRMTADAFGSIAGSSDGRYPEKFMAFHQVSVNIGKKFNLGLFESVIFSPRDSVNRSAFDLSYLNPVIFYRAIEQQSGSPDNVIVGTDFKWNAIRRLSFYGQVTIDEFKLSHLKAGDGWWANKFGGQLGLKYVDVAGIENLDVQLEMNTVSPYTYSHYTQYGSYSNFRQPIAHPLGANFKEFVGILRYQPTPRLNLVAKVFYAKIGRDTTGVNWGSDILKNNKFHQNDFGNTIGQGVSNTLTFVDLTASFQVRHNLFIDVKQTFRNSKSPVAFYNTNTSVTSLALRLNIAKRSYDF
ncbi:MAG TPA: hypothetical protein VK517_14165 [Cyclobacteriaceae bacterium]|nr:hypothetical protein [Cyclobacteriaceae bacterium]